MSSCPLLHSEIHVTATFILQNLIENLVVLPGHEDRIFVLYFVLLFLFLFLVVSSGESFGNQAAYQLIN